MFAFGSSGGCRTCEPSIQLRSYPSFMEDL